MSSLTNHLKVNFNQLAATLRSLASSYPSMSFFHTITRKLSSVSIGTRRESLDEESPSPSESIRAHSTITKMLSLIRRGRTFNEVSTDTTRRRELRVLTALATVLVRESEVVAVVAKSENASSKIELIVCPHVVSDNGRPSTPQNNRFGDSVWTMFAGANPRTDRPNDSLRFTGPYPVIVDPRPPPNLHDIYSLTEHIEGGLCVYLPLLGARTYFIWCIQPGNDIRCSRVDSFHPAQSTEVGKRDTWGIPPS
jgi:hypothetical protein